MGYYTENVIYPNHFEWMQSFLLWKRKKWIISNIDKESKSQEKIQIKWTIHISSYRIIKSPFKPQHSERTIGPNFTSRPNLLTGLACLFYRFSEAAFIFFCLWAYLVKPITKIYLFISPKKTTVAPLIN